MFRKCSTIYYSENISPQKNPVKWFHFHFTSFFFLAFGANQLDFFFLINEITNLLFSLWMHKITKTNSSHMFISDHRFSGQNVGEQNFHQINFEMRLAILFDQFEKCSTILIINHPIVENSVSFMTPKSVKNKKLKHKLTIEMS